MEPGVESTPYICGRVSLLYISPIAATGPKNASPNRAQSLAIVPKYNLHRPFDRYNSKLYWNRLDPFEKTMTKSRWATT